MFIPPRLTLNYHPLLALSVIPTRRSRDSIRCSEYTCDFLYGSVATLPNYSSSILEQATETRMPADRNYHRHISDQSCSTLLRNRLPTGPLVRSAHSERGVGLRPPRPRRLPPSAAATIPPGRRTLAPHSTGIPHRRIESLIGVEVPVRLWIPYAN